MQIKKRERQRLIKTDSMELVFSRTSELSGSICIPLSKDEFNKHAKDFINHSKVIAIYEGETKVLIIYGG